MNTNRWELSENVKEKYKPIVQKFLNKMENLTDEEIENMDNKEFILELSDTELRPYTLWKLLEEFGYVKNDIDRNGWQMDFWIDMVKSGESYPSGCEKLCIGGCGITFELYLSIREFM